MSDRRCRNQMIIERIVVLVPNVMFPKPSLPNPLFAALDHARTQVLWRRDMSREGGFDLPPPRRKIGVVLRQGPDHVQMCRQDHRSVDLEGALLLAQSHGTSQDINPIHEQTGIRVRQMHGEKVGPSGDESAAVHCHTAKLRALR